MGKHLAGEGIDLPFFSDAQDPEPQRGEEIIPYIVEQRIHSARQTQTMLGAGVLEILLACQTKDFNSDCIVE